MFWHYLNNTLSLGLRGIPQIYIAHILLNSNTSTSANLMYQLQQIPNIVTLIFSFLFSGYIIELKKMGRVNWDTSFLSLSLLVGAVMTCALDVLQLQIFVYFLAINFRSNQFRLKKTNAAILLPALSVGLIATMNTATELPPEMLLKYWLFVSSALYLLPSDPKISLNPRDFFNPVLAKLNVSLKKGGLAVFVIAIFITEREIVNGLPISDYEKKSFFFYLSLFNIPILIGSGILGIIGPQYVNATKAKLLEIARLKQLAQFAQAAVCIAFGGGIVLYFETSTRLQEFIFLKSALVLALFQYQANQQKYIFLDQIDVALKAGIVQLAAWVAPMFLFAAVFVGINGFYFFVVASLVVTHPLIRLFKVAGT